MAYFTAALVLAGMDLKLTHHPMAGAVLEG
jgi:hypothetical protein